MKNPTVSTHPFQVKNHKKLGSYELQENEEVDGFLSYRWKTGRWNLHLCFLSYFGGPLIVMMMTIVFPFMVIIWNFWANATAGARNQQYWNQQNNSHWHNVTKSVIVFSIFFSCIF